MFLNNERQPTELEATLAHYCEAIEQDAARELADEQALLAARPLWRGPCVSCGMHGTSMMGTGCPNCGQRAVR